MFYKRLLINFLFSNKKVKKLFSQEASYFVENFQFLLNMTILNAESLEKKNRLFNNKYFFF